MRKELAELDRGLKSEVVQTWLNSFTAGTLTTSLLQEWYLTQIPGFFFVEKSGQIIRSLKSTDQLPTLTRYLEEFIFGEKDAAELMKKIKRITPVCGRSFKYGEPSYNCRECSKDNSCVMCAECFLNSKHKHHKYRMATSSGGGYCDCGDLEAWQRFPFCDTHKPSSDAPPASDIPSDIYDRSKLIFSFLLQLSLNVINKGYSTDRSVQNLCTNEEYREQYLVLIYNDEIHTFDQVINILIRVANVTPKEGLDLASKINKQGRAVITGADFSTCCSVKLAIEGLSSPIFGSHRLLEVQILPFEVVAHQCFALDSLLWMKNLVKVSKGFELAVMEVLRGEWPNHSPLLDQILVQDSVLWKAARNRWNELLCSAFLSDNQSKKILATQYFMNYPEIMKNHLSDEDDRSFSIAGLSVQLFTVPSISQELVSKHNALESVMNFIINTATNDRKGYRNLHNTLFPRSFEQACYLLHDVRYLLCSPPTLPWPEELREGFCKGLGPFMDLLGFIEAITAVKRQLGAHSEYELEWATAFDLQLKCFPVISLSLEWCASDEKALADVFKASVSKLQDVHSELQGDYVKISVLDSTFIFERFDTNKNDISLHLPLTRYWGALCLMLIRSSKCPGEEVPIAELVKPVIRTRAMIAQIEAGMWRKNGSSMKTQIIYYHNAKFRNNTLDLDTLVLQIGASLIDSNEFLASLAYHFGILGVLFPEQKTVCGLPAETSTYQWWALIEEFLYLIIVLISERFHVGVGDVTMSDCMKYVLYHDLMIGRKTHSELINAAGALADDTSLLEAVVEDLTKSRTDTNGNGKYELANPHQPLFNMFYYHYTKEMSYEAEQIQKRHNKKQTGLGCCPPPSLPNFLGPFSNIINLLGCNIMVHIIKFVLDLWLEKSNGIDGLLHKILYLCGLGLWEQEKSDSFRFTDKATDSKIVHSLLEIYRSSRLMDNKDLMKWVLLKFGCLNKDESIEMTIMDHDRKGGRKPEFCESKERAKAARARIMSSMEVLQRQFNKTCQESADVQEKKETPDTNSSLICILCQGSESVPLEDDVLVYAGFVQLSTVHARSRDTPEDGGDMFITTKLHPSPFISSCGHAMHSSCWEAWRLEASQSRISTSLLRPLSHNPNKDEFLCPLCATISNIVMPIMPSKVLADIHNTKHSLLSVTFRQWLQMILELEETCDSSDTMANLEPQNSTLPHSLPHGSPILNHTRQVGYTSNSADKGANNIQSIIDTDLREIKSAHMDIPCKELELIKTMESKIRRMLTNSPNLTDTPDLDCETVWRTLAYTVHSLEASLRFCQKPLFSGINFRESVCLMNLIRISHVLTVNRERRYMGGAEDLTEVKLFNMIVKKGGTSRCILDWDCFGVLVVLIVASPNILHSQTTSADNFLLRLMLISRIAQVLITMDLGECCSSSTENEKSEAECVKFLLNMLGPSIRCNPDEVWQYVKDTVRPFLRCCSIFFHCKQPEKFSDVDLENDTFETLATYLQLPTTCKELLDDDLTYHLFMTWTEHPKIREYLTEGKSSSKFEQYTKEIGTNRINTLIQLPKCYSELLNRVKDFSCSSDPDIDDSQHPTICLICGKVLCSLSYCCQRELNQLPVTVGACTYHANECGAGVGIFLRIRDCHLFVLAQPGRGCYKTPPYLDEHYEPDEGLRRGNKLILSEESYRRLELSWINHSLYDLVARSIENGGSGTHRWLVL